MKSKLVRHVSNIAAMATLAAVVLLLHGNTLSGFWRFDDPAILNFSLNHSLIEAFFRPDVWQKLGAPFFTPLLTLSYGIDIWFFGLHAHGFYLHQLIVLFVAAWLTYLLLLRWVSPLWALFGGGLFLCGLPVTVVAQQTMTRHYVEGLIFSIVALLCFHESAQRRWLAWVGALCYLVAMSAKEVYAPLIFFLLVLEPFHLVQTRAFIARIAPFCLAALIYAPWRLYMLGGMGGYVSRLLPFPGEVWQFISSAPEWVFGGGVQGLAAGLLTTVLVATGIRNGAIRPVPVVFSAGLLAAPLLPLMASLRLPLEAEYFMVHRYLFLPWWVLTCALILVLAQIGKGGATDNRQRWVRWLPLLCCLVLAGTTLQRWKDSCLEVLIAENERIYVSAWELDGVGHVVVPQEFVPYAHLMFGHIAAIRKVQPDELPTIHGVGDVFPLGADIQGWAYNPRTCKMKSP